MVCHAREWLIYGSVEPRSHLSVNFCFYFGCRGFNCYILYSLIEVYYMLGLIFFGIYVWQKYFQKSRMKVHMMSHRSNESQYKLSFHLSDAKTFWKMYSLTEFSQKSYLCCGRYFMARVDRWILLNKGRMAYVSLRLRVQNAVSPQPCVGKLRISLVLFNFLDCNFRLWFETP